LRSSITIRKAYLSIQYTWNFSSLSLSENLAMNIR
jgi:hypothetical protein